MSKGARELNRLRLVEAVDAAQVHREDAVPRGQGQHFGEGIVADTGIVYQDIEVTEATDGFATTVSPAA